MKRIKLFKSKKGFNDVSLLIVLILINLVSAWVITSTLNAFNSDSIDVDNSAIMDRSLSETDGISKTQSFSFLGTLIKFAYFDYGDSLGLPLILDIFFFVVYLAIATIVARNIWIGGGG